MVDRVEARFDITPQRLIGDTAYGIAPMLGWMVNGKGIEPHTPVGDKTERKDDSGPATAGAGEMWCWAYWRHPPSAGLVPGNQVPS